MHGIRYLSIVTPKFIKIALALTWLVPLVLSTAAFVWFHVSLDILKYIFLYHRLRQEALY